MNRTRITDSRTEVALPFVTSDPRRFLLLVAIELILIAALIAFVRLSGHAGPQLALIPTLIAVTATKFFGKSKNEDSVFGDHPAVSFTFSALATGAFKDVDKMVAENFAAYANGYPVVEPDSRNGPVEFVQNISYWRKAVPDLSVVIYDEVTAEEADKTDSIAVRFVLAGTLTAPDLGVDHGFEIEAAAFIKVVDQRMSEWRVVVDSGFLDELRTAMGHPLP